MVQLMYPIIVPSETYLTNIMDENPNENFDSTNEATEEVDNTEEVEETVADTETDDSEQLKETNKRLFERAKKAEAEAKRMKDEDYQRRQAEVDKAKPKEPAPQGVDPDELRLLAKGLSDEEIDQAKVLSRGKGISLPEALKDPMFVAYQKDLVEQRRKEKAKLGASKGSGEADEESAVKPNMTKEEHMEVWKKHKQNLK